MADNRELTTIIGPDAIFKGEMSFEGKAKILGTFEGKIQAKGEVTIESGSSCRAAVEAASILVDGAVEGNLTAIDKMHLSARASVKGDIRAGTLIVTEGAAFTGHVSVGPDAVKEASGRLGASSLASSSLEGKPAIPQVKTKVRGTEWLGEAAGLGASAAA